MVPKTGNRDVVSSLISCDESGSGFGGEEARQTKCSIGSIGLIGWIVFLGTFLGFSYFVEPGDVRQFFTFYHNDLTDGKKIKDEKWRWAIV
jgi:hypothetical protein